MEFGPEDFTNVSDEIRPEERKASSRKLLLSVLAALAVGVLIIPLAFVAFEHGWLDKLGYGFVALFALAYGIDQYQKAKRS